MTDTSESHLSEHLAESFFQHLYISLAVITLWVPVCQFFALSFQFFSYTLVGLVVVSNGVLLRLVSENNKPSSQRDMSTVTLLTFAGLICVFLTLVSHHSDADDYYYTPNVVYYLEHPTEPMSLEVHFLTIDENCPVRSYTLNAVEYGQGAIAYTFHLPFLNIYYFYLPAIVAFLLPWSIYLLLCRWGEGTSAEIALSTLLTIGIILLCGETHRTFGNFNLTRLYQGKAVFLAVGLPYFWAQSLSYFNKPRGLVLSRLHFAVLAQAGITNSSVSLLLVAIVLLGGAEVIYLGFSRCPFKKMLWYATSGWFLILKGIFLFLFLRTDTAQYNLINLNWPQDIWGQAQLLFNPRMPFTPVIIVLSLLFVLIGIRHWLRWFMSIWILLLFLLFMTPLTSTFIMQYFLPPNIYWRIFYLIPYPLLIGGTVLHIIRRVSPLHITKKLMCFLFAFLLVVGGHLVPGSPSAFNYKTTFHFPPQYKLPAGDLQVARGVVNVAPGGTMLASPKISGVIPMLSGRHPQVCVRGGLLRVMLTTCGDKERASVRIFASQFAGGDGSKFGYFMQFLTNDPTPVRSIVLHRTVVQYPRTIALLEQFSFSRKEQIGDYWIFSK